MGGISIPSAFWDSEIEHELELAGPHHRQIGSPLAFENPTRIDPGLVVCIVPSKPEAGHSDCRHSAVGVENDRSGRKWSANPGTLGTCFSGAPDTIRTGDLCRWSLASTRSRPRKAVAVIRPTG